MSVFAGQVVVVTGRVGGHRPRVLQARWRPSARSWCSPRGTASGSSRSRPSARQPAPRPWSCRPTSPTADACQRADRSGGRALRRHRRAGEQRRRHHVDAARRNRGPLDFRAADAAQLPRQRLPDVLRAAAPQALARAAWSRSRAWQGCRRADAHRHIPPRSTPSSASSIRCASRSRTTGVSVTLVCPDFVVSEIHRRALGADGQPLGANPMANSKIMTAERCAALMIGAIERRERMLLTSARGSSRAG